MVITGYSINILPPGKKYNRFVSLINKLAKEYNAPIFAPHITVLGQASESDQEALKGLEELVTNQPPFEVTLKEVGFQDYFFRALYVLAEKTPLLIQLHEKAKKIFKKPDTPSYMPHLSLLYGDFPVSIKEKIIEEIGKEQPSAFTVKSVWLFNTAGETKDWYPVKEFVFK